MEGQCGAVKRIRKKEDSLNVVAAENELSPWHVTHHVSTRSDCSLFSKEQVPLAPADCKLQTSRDQIAVLHQNISSRPPRFGGCLSQAVGSCGGAVIFPHIGASLALVLSLPEPTVIRR
jgi:hypothetical protein